jgi:hypothetical protein
VSNRFVIPSARSKPLRTREALDVAARYFVYKLYDASRGASTASSWQSVRLLGEAAATVSRAVERGWVIIRDEGKGRTKELRAALTKEGRAVARKGLQTS